MAKKKASPNIKKLKLNLINAKGLVEFLNKFKSVDTNILLSITPDLIEVRSVTPIQSAFKVGELNFEDIFVLPDGEDIPEVINIGILNVEKFTKIFSYIDEDNITLNISYKDNDSFSLKMDIRTATLQKNYLSAGKNSFYTMTDEEVERAFNVEDSMFKISFDKNILDKINNLLNLETAKYFHVVCQKGVISFVGKEFKLKYSGDIEIINDGDVDIAFEKGAFKYADKENYELYAKESGILLFSNDSNFKVGLCAADITVTSSEDGIEEDED